MIETQANFEIREDAIAFIIGIMEAYDIDYEELNY